MNCVFCSAFISGLLNNIGTHVDPIILIQKIRQGLEIPGLRNSLVKILQDYYLQVINSESSSQWYVLWNGCPGHELWNDCKGYALWNCCQGFIHFLLSTCIIHQRICTLKLFSDIYALKLFCFMLLVKLNSTLYKKLWDKISLLITVVFKFLFKML